MEDNRGSFTVIDEATPWLLRARSTPLELEVTLTDLRGYFVGRLDASSVESQIKSWGGNNIGQMIRLLHKHLAGSERLSCFPISPTSEDDDGMRRLLWVIKDVTCFTFMCRPAPAPATLLRDELILPLMRATEQLRRLVPSEAATAWKPDADAMPLPQFGAPPLQAMLAHASSATDPVNAASLAVVAKSNGGDASAGTSAGASSAAGESSTTVERLPPQPLPPLASGAQPAPTAAEPAVSEQERKRHAAHLAREKAAKKAARKAGGP